MHGADRWGEEINFCLLDELPCLLRGGERVDSFGLGVVKGGRGADVSDFGLDQNVWVDRLESFDRLPGLFHVLFERQLRQVENDGVESGARSFQGLLEGVRVIGVEIDGLSVLFANAFHQSGRLANADEFSLTLGNSYDYGDVELASGIGNRFENNQIRKIEVTQRSMLIARCLERLSKAWNCHVRSFLHCGPKVLSRPRYLCRVKP